MGRSMGAGLAIPIGMVNALPGGVSAPDPAQSAFDLANVQVGASQRCVQVA